MKSSVRTFIEELLPYDYLLFGGALLLFLLFIIIAILKREKIKTALFFTLLAFVTIIIMPTYGYVKLHEILFANKVELVSQKKLQFVEAVVIKGRVTNLSDKDFKQCKITAQLHKVSKNKYRNYILQFKPFKKRSIVEYNIEQNSTKEFKMIIEPFRYKYKFGVDLKADCR